MTSHRIHCHLAKSFSAKPHFMHCLSHHSSSHFHPPAMAKASKKGQVETKPSKTRTKHKPNTTCPSNNQPFKNGTKVEVCTNEEGFKDAWYLATFIKPPSLGTSRGKALVKYETLVSDVDQSEPLIEYVDLSSIRPLPPPPLVNEECFEPYDVVDALYRDGWWKGVVVTKVEKERFTVVFENPPHEIMFRAYQLRSHLDWVNGSWEKPPKQMRMQGLNLSKGMAVEVNLESQKSLRVWFPATIIDEVGFNSFLVMLESTKTNNDSSLPYITVDCLHIRPPPPLDLALKEFRLYDMVDAFCDSGWRDGLVIKQLSDDMHIVLLKDTMEERQFTCSEMRRHMNWINGKWDALIAPEPLEMIRDADKNTQIVSVESTGTSHVDESSCKGESEKFIEQSGASPAKPMSRKGKERMLENKLKQLCSPKRAKKGHSANSSASPAPIAPLQPIDALDQEGPVTSCVEVNTEKEVDASFEKIEGAEVHGDARDLDNQDHVDLPITVWEEPAGSLPEAYVIVPRAGNTSVKGNIDESSSGGLVGDQPLSLCFEGLTPIGFPKRHLTAGGGDAGMQSSILVGSQAPEIDDTPFVKSSPIWKEVESMEPFRSMPQKPHFCPLVKYNEETREGMAIGHMIVFATVLEKASRVQLDDPSDPINRCLQTIAELKSLGFDVKAVEDHLTKLSSIKERRALLQNLSKEVDAQIAEHLQKKSKIEEDVILIDRELQALEEKWASFVAMKLEKETQIASLQIDAKRIKEKVSFVEDEFRNVATESWCLAG